MEANDAVHLCRDSLIVRGDERGAALPSNEVEKLRKDNVRSGFIKIASRLVGEDQWRAIGEGPSDCDSLLLAAG